MTRAYNVTSCIDVGPFNDDDAAKCLLGLTNIEGNLQQSVLEDALAVARRLGGLLLGLAQTAEVISRIDYTFKEFL